MSSWPTHLSDWRTEAPEYCDFLKAEAKWWDGGGSQACSVDTFLHGLREPFVIYEADNTVTEVSGLWLTPNRDGNALGPVDCSRRSCCSALFQVKWRAEEDGGSMRSLF